MIIEDQDQYHIVILQYVVFIVLYFFGVRLFFVATVIVFYHIKYLIISSDIHSKKILCE